MRISEDRYDRDRQRLELALRFLTHEARTQTIRVWTGLTDDRIRNVLHYTFNFSFSASTTVGDRDNKVVNLLRGNRPNRGQPPWRVRLAWSRWWLPHCGTAGI